MESSRQIKNQGHVDIIVLPEGRSAQIRPKLDKTAEVEVSEGDENETNVRLSQRRRSTNSAGTINRALASTVPIPGKTQKYLEHFLIFLYYVGMNPFQPRSGDQLPKWLVWLQKIIYWTLALVSVLDAADGVKYGWLHFRVKEDMFTFLYFGYMFASFLTRIYYIKVFAVSSASTSYLLEKISNGYGDDTDTMDRWAKAIAFTVGTVSLFLAGIVTLMGQTAINEWSAEESLLLQSYELSETLFLWSSNDWQNNTQRLWDYYGTNLTTTTIMFAIVGNFLSFCGTLHACVLIDLWSIIAIQIYSLELQLSKDLHTSKQKSVDGRCPLSCNWQQYTQLRETCDQLDKTFGILLNLTHMQNMLLFGYLLLEVLQKDPVNSLMLIDLITVVKVSVSYYIALKAGSQNMDYKACVIECSKRQQTTDMGGIELCVPVLLEDMKDHPIGIGRGEFFVNDTFILKFAGLVGSIFLLLSNESKED